MTEPEAPSASRHIRYYLRRRNDPAYKRKHAARAAVRAAIHDGRLVRLPCERCGKKGEAHHDNYDMQLEVKWLCRKHHSEVHNSKTHCPKGHPYTGDNLAVWKDGFRNCRTCKRARNKRRRKTTCPSCGYQAKVRIDDRLSPHRLKGGFSPVRCEGSLMEVAL